MKKFDCGFTQVSNLILINKNISLEAKGLYTYLMSKPDKWSFNVQIILLENNISLEKLNQIMDELITNQYIAKEQIEDGNFKYTFLEPTAIKYETKKKEEPTKTKIQLESEKYEVYSLRLKKYVEDRKRKSIENKTILSWNNSFRKLFKELLGKRTEEESKKAVEDVFFYLENENDSKDKYKFVVESAESFREKFLKLESAAHRKNGYTSFFKDYKKMDDYVL